jgi:hypothetical protein
MSRSVGLDGWRPTRIRPAEPSGVRRLGDCAESEQEPDRCVTTLVSG